eukprot:852497-Prorocentrum_lima.AAC.1
MSVAGTIQRSLSIPLGRDVCSARAWHVCGCGCGSDVPGAALDSLWQCWCWGWGCGSAFSSACWCSGCGSASV